MESALHINRKRPYVTYALIGINVLIFLVENVLEWTGMDFNQMLLVMGAKHNVLITLGQYWRLLTATFLHASLTHILFNALALYVWGPNIEVLLGRTRYIAVYLVAGISGSLLSYLCSTSMSVGASGAIFGLFGTLLYFRTRHKQLFNQVFGLQVLVVIGINLLNGFMQAGVDNFGHIGGLLGGYAMAYVTGLYRERLTGRRALAGLALLLTLAGMLLFGIWRYSHILGIPMFTPLSRVQFQ